MNLKDDADRVEIMRNTIALVKNLNHPFKLMVDREAIQQLYNLTTHEFKETNDHMFFDGIMVYRNDYISGVWVEFQ